MIIITGATGKLGKAVVERLLKNLPPDQIGISVRDPEKALAFQEQGVRIRKGDFADPAGLRHAFEGASQVLVVSVNSLGETAVQLHRNAIEAAKAAGAQRVLYTSHMGARADSVLRDHIATERILEESGLAFTSLRNGFYSNNALMLMGNAFKTGEVVAPKDGPVSWTTHADLADATAAVLIQEGRLDGITPPLTASESLDLAALAEIAGSLTGREMKRVVVSDEEYRAGMIARGAPEMQADLLIEFFAASRRGEFAAVDPVLDGLLGRPATSMQEFIGSHLPQ